MKSSKQFTKQSINKLEPQVHYKRSTIRGLGLVIEQRSDLIVFMFKYRSPVTLKYRHVKLTAIEYGTATADIVNSIRNQCKVLDAKVINQIDPIEEEKQLKADIAAKERFLQLADGTQAGYLAKFNKLNDHFGKRAVNTIFRLEIEAFLESLLPSLEIS
ncbi:MAG: hypothetical protein KZQ70_09680 [gamma proteobacterium symbiont of Lucinoma myriamae]|nr:hypothetical protein [gamma proteobacterium symbiont of Lucinoma myriamae]